MIRFDLLFFLYSPVCFLCLLFFVKNRYIFYNEDVDSQLFSLLPAIILIFFLLNNYLVQSLWYNFYSYSQLSWELYVFVWNFAVLFIIVLIMKRKKITLNQAFNLKKKYAYRVIRIGFYITCFFVFMSLLFGFEITHDAYKAIHIKEMSPLLLIVLLFNTIILLPLVEEIVFRGILYVPLYRKVGQKAAIFLTSYIFLHLHFSLLLQDYSGAVAIFFKGLFLTWLYDKYKTLIYPLGFHVLFNLLFVYLLLFPSANH